MHNKKLVSPETNIQPRLSILFENIEAVVDDIPYNNECRVVTKSGSNYNIAMDFDSVNRLWDQYLSEEYNYISDEAGNFLGVNE